ncbi:hypothetical protein DFH07DRAFT_767644 [Mycena maculata]|uniref:Uncharacterized protein n=1 Tax=Mycena maculata TaxID=230809 RepID=A0AAD7JZF4_9AGAR|nr:hypothetical protein DFH07DRAFT_767644 [Mycena maculata]
MMMKLVKFRRGSDRSRVAVSEMPEMEGNGMRICLRNAEGGKDCKDNAEITDWSGKAEYRMSVVINLNGDCPESFRGSSEVMGSSGKSGAAPEVPKKCKNTFVFQRFVPKSTPTGPKGVHTILFNRLKILRKTVARGKNFGESESQSIGPTTGCIQTGVATWSQRFDEKKKDDREADDWQRIYKMVLYDLRQIAII